VLSGQRGGGTLVDKLFWWFLSNSGIAPHPFNNVYLYITKSFTGTNEGV